MNDTETERHIAELRLALQGLVEEAEHRVTNLEAELVQAKEVVRRMKSALSESQKPF